MLQTGGGAGPAPPRAFAAAAPAARSGGYTSDVIRSSLGGKFVVAFAGLAVLFAATFGGLAAYRLRHALIEQVRIRAKVVAEEFAREASRFIVTPEGQSEVPITSRITRRLVAGTVLYAQIVREGTVRFVDVRPGVGTEIPSLLESPAPVLTRPFVVEMRRAPSGVPYLELFRAIPEFPLESQTYVRIGFPLADVLARIRSETWVVLIASLTLAAAGVGLAFLLQRAVLGPLDRMIAAIRNMRGGDYSARVEVRSSDELEVLAEEFNTMAGSIEARDRELARVNEDLQKANRVKDAFSAAMSHELKTPLHAVRAYAQLLLEEIDGPLTEAQRLDLEALLGAGDHLLHLIGGILRYSALEAGGAVPQPAAVDVAAVVEQSRKNVAHLARQKGLPIVMRVGGAPHLWADETMVRQILINLLHNAIKYTEEGQITVTAEPHGGEVIFAVADTGPGIAPGHELEVFEPFRRAGHADRKEIDGIGLGLAVAKRYVEMQGGRIWFESAQSTGTTFYVALPTGPA